MAKPIDLSDKFQRIVNRLLEQNVILFVGAGISVESRVLNNNRFKPTVKFMFDTLLERLRAEINNKKIPKKVLDEENIYHRGKARCFDFQSIIKHIDNMDKFLEFVNNETVKPSVPRTKMEPVD
ncbi:MAG: hypothetical protein H7832_01015 [Magnetococcus sp. DMHC-6]